MNQLEKDDHRGYFDTICNLCVYVRSLRKNERGTGNNESDLFVALKRMQICIYTKKQ